MHKTPPRQRPQTAPQNARRPDPPRHPALPAATIPRGWKRRLDCIDDQRGQVHAPCTTRCRFAAYAARGVSPRRACRPERPRPPRRRRSSPRVIACALTTSPPPRRACRILEAPPPDSRNNALPALGPPGIGSPPPPVADHASPAWRAATPRRAQPIGSPPMRMNSLRDSRRLRPSDPLPLPVFSLLTLSFPPSALAQSGE